MWVGSLEEDIVTVAEPYRALELKNLLYMGTSSVTHEVASYSC